ncbi:GMC family oxidoreductase [Thiomicrorhabdus sp. 6S3-12]|uniref:GMC family oxidoreductase n=1 Tax=Thiomicrorhabdus sp. 6S3-12 TaxID=2819681 RepID=UPI001AAD5AB2|nr:GMC family oxidoreductase [Thiomicrorhabdus sp. 6S3-12]MBO1924848.1 GMC family oxidoreductase [Thiomicrorhabdus sp. 6S3-12]
MAAHIPEFDVCVIGSGAGGGPVAFRLAQAGYQVLVLEKGPWLKEEHFFKDELSCCRHSIFTPDLADEQHVLETRNDYGDWYSEATSQSGWNFWNGNMVGGSSNLMSGFFYRLKPQDFRLKSEFGAIAGANIEDWPISYDDLEPYYTLVESEVGVSGHAVDHTFAEPRSTEDFPHKPTAEHPIVKRIESACDALGYQPLPTPRAILSTPDKGRRSCEYSGFCGSYGCASGAKGSSRAALLDRAVKSGKCHIWDNCKVNRLISGADGKVVEAEFVNAEEQVQKVTAKIFVVACQAVETSRLLLASVGPKHLKGLGNNHDQVGKNLLFSAGGAGSGDLLYADLDPENIKALQTRGPFVNRNLQKWYVIDDEELGGRVKGGTIDFLLRHPNALPQALPQKWDDDGNLLWGKTLQKRIKSAISGQQTLNFEVFNDWLPTDNCFVSLDSSVKDRWNQPVAKVRLGYHEHDLKVGNYLADKAAGVLQQMGAKNINWSVSGSPPANLMAGGCRFGTEIETSVLDPDCRMHDCENLYVTDGSFMPTGGSVTYTWTIYANAFRVADKIIAAL